MHNYSVICSYADQMLVVYNIQCGDGEQAFFNITSQNIQPRDCNGPRGEQVYVSVYFYKRNFWLLIANWGVIANDDNDHIF